MLVVEQMLLFVFTAQGAVNQNLVQSETHGILTNYKLKELMIFMSLVEVQVVVLLLLLLEQLSCELFDHLLLINVHIRY